MKIAHVITRLIVGGAQENTIFTVEGLAKRGHQVDLITGPTTGPEGSLEQRVPASGVRLLRIRHLVRNINLISDCLAFRKLFCLFRKERYDIIHTHSAKAGIIGRLAGRLALPEAVVIHTIHGPSFYPYQPVMLRFLYTLAERIAGWFTDYFICVGEVMKETYVKAGIGQPSQYRVIYSGFDLLPYLAAETNRQTFRQRLNIREDERVIGMIGRLFPLKGQEYLLAAFSRVARAFPKAKLLLVGDGILRPQLESQTERYGIQDKVIFSGLVRPEEIPEYVAVMDIAAHTSFREGLPKAVAQGLAGVKSVVAFD
ncbi:MAG: glycosyltransferase, partial [Candidatus Omnitrophica bacterium]|nr:glycosyltransferase [Candidatus Omnitrophota bacterium]